MSNKLTPERLHELADRLLLEGSPVTLETLSQRFEIGEPNRQLEGMLQQWWQSLAGRVSLTPPGGAPEALSRALKILWQDAVREAGSQLNREQQPSDSSRVELHRESASLLRSSQADYGNLEDQLKRQQMINDEALNQVKALEAEASVLRSTLVGETNLRKEAEEKLRDANHDLKQELRAREKVRGAFDQRLREEQAQGRDLVAKAESETLHFRDSLEQLRDDAGKKESAMTKNLHNLRGEQARKEVKIESLKGQVRGLEVELKTMRADTGSQSQQLAKANTRLLAVTNQAKRLEQRVEELEKERQQERQRLAQDSAEAQRKTKELRAALKAREEELTRAKASLSGLQLKMTAQEGEIRRLKTLLRG